MLTAIPTVYRGTQFRSRQEARWAMTLDALEVEWEYEKEGYQLATCWYVPDFWLPLLKSFAEVKGSTEQWDIHCEIKASDLVKASGFSLIILNEISPLGMLPRVLVADNTLPWGYEVYWGDLPQTAACGRLWLDKEAPAVRSDITECWPGFHSRIDAIRRHRFYAPR